MNAFQREVTDEVKRTGQVQRNVMVTWSFIGRACEDSEDIADAIAASLHRIGIYAYVEVWEPD